MRHAFALCCMAALAWAQDPLKKYGLGDPKTPVRIFFSHAPELSRVPRLVWNKRPAPDETEWIFDDPAPVWRALRVGKTKGFETGRFGDNNDAWLVLVVGRDPKPRVSPVIQLHGKKGQLTIATYGKKGMVGGTWTVGEESERALVALLSKTKPDTIGGRHFWLDGARWHGKKGKSGLEVRVVRSREQLRNLPREFKPWIPRLPAKSGYDEPIELGPQAYVAVWINRDAPTDRLTHIRYPLIRKKTFLWKLRLEPDRKRSGTPGIVGVFEVPHHIERFVVEVDKHGACVVELNEKREYLPGRETARVDVGKGVCVLFEGGAYRWLRPGAATLCGTLPVKLRSATDPAALRQFLDSRAR